MTMVLSLLTKKHLNKVQTKILPFIHPKSTNSVPIEICSERCEASETALLIVFAELKRRKTHKDTDNFFLVTVVMNRLNTQNLK
jgi:hypothetical protein